MLVFLFGICLISLVSGAQDYLGTFKQLDIGECEELSQTCGNCTYNNISIVMRTGENPETFILNAEMSVDDSGTYFNYSFCNLTEIGTYNVHGFGDIDGEKTSWVYEFYVTPSGFKNMLGFFIIYVI